MDRSKIVAIITGVISVLLAIAYLVIVQLLDFRGEMLPAPQSQAPSEQVIASLPSRQILALVPAPVLAPLLTPVAA